MIDMDQARFAAEQGGDRSRKAQIAPGRCLEIELAITPAEQQVIARIAGIGEMVGLNKIAPVGKRVAARQDEAGMDAIVMDIDGDAGFRLAPINPGGLSENF